MVFELFQKLHLQIYVSQFMTSKIIALSVVILNLESMERKEKMQKVHYLKNKKSFFDEANFFLVFEGLSFGEKIKLRV